MTCDVCLLISEMANHLTTEERIFIVKEYYLNNESNILVQLSSSSTSHSPGKWLHIEHILS
jgi:hypothetical protein